MSPKCPTSVLAVLLLAVTIAGSGCSTFTNLKREMAGQPPRRQLRKEDAVAEFESKRDDAQVQAALNRYVEGDHAACRRQLTALVERKPTMVEARLQLAELQLSQGELDGAESQLRAALEVAPDRADIHDCLARVLEAGSRTSEAESHFQTAARLDPDFQLDRPPETPAEHRTAALPVARH